MSGEVSPGDPSVAVRRVRILAGAVVVLNWMVTSDGYDLTTAKARLVGLSVCMILLVNALESRGVLQRIFPGARAGLVDALVDVVWTVSVCVAAQSPADAPWIVLLIPVIGAVAQASMSIALLVWAVEAFFYLFARLFVTQGAQGTQVSTELSPVVEQLGLILLVVLPAGYLTEQLAADVRRQRRATAAADERSRMLRTVADVGSRIARLGADAGELVCDGARNLGFRDAAAYRNAGDGWRRTTRPLTSDDHMPLELPPDGDDSADPSTVTVPLVEGPQGINLRVTGHEAISADQRVALDLLGRHASVAMRNAELLARLQRMHDDLDRRANHDALTGLPNRHRLGQVLDRLGQVEPPAGSTVVLLFLDLDGFKPVNDRLGHDAGDALLRQIAARLRGAVREPDLVARLGGDEFTVLTAVGALGEAVELASRLVEVVSEPVVLDSTQVRVGVSIGLAEWAVGMSPSELMRRADVAMYQAKSDGRGTVRSYSSNLDEREQRTFTLLNDIEQQLLDDGMALVYQPVLATSDPATVVGFEALLRWDHPVFGAVPPDETVELVRRRNLAHQLTGWIVRRSIRDLAQMRRATGRPLFVSINLSPHELLLDGLEHLIARTLAEVDLPADCFMIEINEGTQVTAETVERMRTLRALGVRLLIDDWGQKATSLAQIRLPVDGIKLDRSLFASEADGLNRQIVETVTAIAQRHGLVVIAEGLERPGDLEITRAAGCDLVQGYLFHRPKTIDELLLASVAS